MKWDYENVGSGAQHNRTSEGTRRASDFNCLARTTNKQLWAICSSPPNPRTWNGTSRQTNGFFKLFRATKYPCQNPISGKTLTNGGRGGATDRTNERGNSISHFQGCSLKSRSSPNAVYFNSPFGSERIEDSGVTPTGRRWIDFSQRSSSKWRDLKLLPHSFTRAIIWCKST